jgi:methionyl-tRNA synthetase
MPTMTKKYYVTTAIPYVNAAPHVGHALEFVQTDVIARYHRLLGEDVYFLSGTDDNALKNVQAAEEKNIPVAKFVKQNSDKYYQFKDLLNISFDDFIRTTEKRHFEGAQALWRACKKEDIYKKKYKGLYCVGCEAFLTEKDLVEGKCPEHKKKPELIEEENYFFKLSCYQEWLEKLIASEKLKIVPDTRKNEVLAFIRQGLEDFSISRTKERAHGWGIPVPGDPNQIIYVWFDALANYITALDWQKKGRLYQKYWPADLHVIGKGIIRFHAIYWPAMLKSAGIPLPKAEFVHGYITVEGEKISKSLGNIIDPFDLVKKYGTDPVRYHLLREIPAYGDGDFSIQRFKEVYNADLANGLGNLVARVAKLGEKSAFDFKPTKNQFYPQVKKSLDRFRFDESLSHLWEEISFCDKYINQEKPWELSGKNLETILKQLVKRIRQISFNLKPFLPETAEIIETQFKGPKIKSTKPLFPRL